MSEMAGCSADLNMSDVLLLEHDDGDLSEDELFYCKICMQTTTRGIRLFHTGSSLKKIWIQKIKRENLPNQTYAYVILKIRVLKEI